MARLQDDIKRLCLVDGLKKFKITFISSQRYKSKPKVKDHYNISQLDINNAFLYGDLDEAIYMSLPDGYFSRRDKRVYRLKKSLYGLKQAPEQWNAKLSQVLIDHALLVYVDDIIVTGSNLHEIEKFKEFLKTRFMIKDLGKLKYFLGIKVVDTDNGICLSQRKYCLDLLYEFGLFACKLFAIPLEQNISISNEPTINDPVIDNITEY
ncbi:ribonuclease H-like domain-containing protein [Tanacetum coccineum]|uniref:Ribonuclease H-like domain-containing protein n=1 Tax=Tanacetum coccineum TaxID=301880 RepID=A0ABQ5E1C1_9ASTR